MAREQRRIVVVGTGSNIGAAICALNGQDLHIDGGFVAPMSVGGPLAL